MYEAFQLCTNRKIVKINFVDRVTNVAELKRLRGEKKVLNIFKIWKLECNKRRALQLATNNNSN